MMCRNKRSIFGEEERWRTGEREDEARDHVDDPHHVDEVAGHSVNTTRAAKKSPVFK